MPTLSLHVPSRTVLVAGRLRTAFERRGFTALPKPPGVILAGFRLALVPAGPSAVWVHTDVVDALPDELGRLLSQDLRATVTTIGTADDIVAVELAEGGRVSSSLSVRGTEVLQSAGLELQFGLDTHGSVDQLLADRGLGDFRRTFEQALTVPGNVVLGFSPKAGAGEVIEIDPGLACPMCREAMRRITGPHGVFYGCVRYPTCKGRLTEKQADGQRTR